MNQSNTSYVVVEGWVLPALDGKIVISADGPSAQALAVEDTSRSVFPSTSNLPVNSMIQAVGFLRGQNLEISEWKTIERPALPKSIDGYRLLVDRVSAFIQAQSSEAEIARPESELDSFVETLQARSDVTIVKPVFTGGLKAYVVVTHNTTAIETEAVSRGFYSRVLIRQARWSSKDVAAAEKLIDSLDDADVVSVSGGITATGDFAMDVTLMTRNEEFEQAVKLLPPGLISVNTWITNLTE